MQWGCVQRAVRVPSAGQATRPSCVPPPPHLLRKVQRSLLDGVVHAPPLLQGAGVRPAGGRVCRAGKGRSSSTVGVASQTCCRPPQAACVAPQLRRCLPSACCVPAASHVLSTAAARDPPLAAAQQHGGAKPPHHYKQYSTAWSACRRWPRWPGWTCQCPPHSRETNAVQYIRTTEQQNKRCRAPLLPTCMTTMAEVLAVFASKPVETLKAVV